MTPWMPPASVAGTAGLPSPTRVTDPVRSRAWTRGTEKVRSTSAAGPETGMKRPSDAVGPTTRPVEESQSRVAVTVAASGPKTAPNWPRRR